MIILALLLLVALGTVSTYAGYHVIGMVGTLLGIGRFLAALLLVVLFARLPRLRNGKFSTVGLLPKIARSPVMFALLGGSLAHYVFRNDMTPALFIGLAIILLLAYRWMRQTLVQRFRAAFLKVRPDPIRPANDESSVIDVDFREKKD